MKRRWPGLLLLTFALTAPGLRASEVVFIDPDPAPATERPSHRPIDNGLENDLSPEKRLADRLKNPRLKKDKAKLDDDFRALAKDLLNDEQFVESLKNLDAKDVARLKKTIEANRDLADDPDMKKLVEESLAGQRLKEKDRDVVQRWKETIGKQEGIKPELGRVGNQKIAPPNPLQQLPAPQTPSGAPRPPNGVESLPKETPEWLKKNLGGASRDFSKWLETPSGKSFRDSLKDFGRRAGDVRNSPAGERARGTSKYLPKPGKWLTDNVAPRSAPRVGSLPRLPTGSAPSSVPRVSAGGALRFVVIIAAVALLLFLAWKSRGMWKGVLALGRSSAWKLGPWPMRPGDVSTRGDLVRAFEYLALLCLGPSARTHHHRDLGRLIGEQPSIDPDRRRDAASTLSRLYEQARYTPDDEPLSPADVEEARRELGYLAGEMAA